MSTATAETSLTLQSCVVRDTAAKKGRTRTVSPAQTSAKHLHYGRIILDAGHAPLSIETGGHETGFIVLAPELAVVVREGDVVLMPKGYHPNVAAPGGSINFLWMMAANRETEDRLFGVVNVHPDFKQTGSGLDAGKAK